MSLEFLRYVSNMSFGEQLRHWGRLGPWQLDKKTVRLRPKPDLIDHRHVTVDDEGHIIRLSRKVLRPCFGSPTAYLIHGIQIFGPSRNGLQLTRCGGCPARQGCHSVAKGRLRISSEVQSAVAEFDKAGGAEVYKEALRSQRPSSTFKFFNDLVRALENAGPFKSVNDERITDYLIVKEAERRQKDADAKAKLRKKQRLEQANAGKPDTQLLDRLRRERTHRKILFDTHRQLEGSSPWLTRGPADNGAFTALVWAEALLTHVQNEKVNASNIAARLIKKDAVPTENHNSLRSRVAAALRRVHRLETIAHPATGKPVWEKLQAKELLQEDVILTADGNDITII